MILQRPRFKFLIYGIGSLVFLMLSVVVFYLLVLGGFFGEMPSKEELKELQYYQASEIYTQDSVLLGTFSKENRVNITYEQFPKHLIHALIATEDVRFFEHEGVDKLSIFRVLFKSILLRDAASGGGSTLSQQLVKNVYPRQSHGIFTMPVNKIKEAVIASYIEEIYTKKEILTLYLNSVPFGENVYGIEVAADRFFSCKPMQLTVPEAATLVGMLKANTFYNPRVNPKNAKERRNVVLAQMQKYPVQKYGALTPKECADYQKTPFEIRYHKATKQEDLAPYFKEYLRKELLAYLEKESERTGKKHDLYRHGYKIYTTLNAKLQQSAEEAVIKRISELQLLIQKQFQNNPKMWELVFEKIVQSKTSKLSKKGYTKEQMDAFLNQPKEMKVWHLGQEVDTMMTSRDSIIHYISTLQAGLLSIEPSTGAIRAWVGGDDYKYFQYDHVTSPRQVGSIFKPIVYASALKQHIDACTFYENVEKKYPEFEDWQPKNAVSVPYGMYSMKGALMHSINTITAQVIMAGGIQNTIDLAKDMGITAHFELDPTIALGSASISLFEMLGAYTVFANKGEYSKPICIQKILKGNGEILLEEKQTHKKVLDPFHAELVTEMLQTVVDKGTAQRLRYYFYPQDVIAGKTGTTQNNVDGWFIGYTPQLLTGIWVGCDNPSIHFTSTYQGQGSNTALPIWAYYMSVPYKDKNMKERYFSAEKTEHLMDCLPYKCDFCPKVDSTVVDSMETMVSDTVIIIE